MAKCTWDKFYSSERFEEHSSVALGTFTTIHLWSVFISTQWLHLMQLLHNFKPEMEIDVALSGCPGIWCVGLCNHPQFYQLEGVAQPCHPHVAFPSLTHKPVVASAACAHVENHSRWPAAAVKPDVAKSSRTEVFVHSVPVPLGSSSFWLFQDPVSSFPFCLENSP